MEKFLRLMGRQLAYLALAAAAAASGGCLFLAAGGAAVGYAYYKGKICETYQATLGDAWPAATTALAELGMPIVAESRDAAGGYIESRTGTGDVVRIHLELLPNKIPSEGAQTRICVRVANFGDKEVSQRVLYQVGLHLAPIGLAAVALPGASPAANAAITQAGGEAGRPDATISRPIALNSLAASRASPVKEAVRTTGFNPAPLAARSSASTACRLLPTISLWTRPKTREPGFGVSGTSPRVPASKWVRTGGGR